MRKKRKRKLDPSELDITELLHRTRGFILDSQVPFAHEIAELIGCSPVSDEVAEKEEEESDKRVDNVDYLIPLVFAYAKTLAGGIIAHQKAHIKEVGEIPEEIWEHSHELFEKVAMATALGAISQLVDLELLHTINKGAK